MEVTFHAVYEPDEGVIRPLEQVNLPEGELVITARVASELPVYDTQAELAAVLGFDPNDEERMAELGRSQSEAIQAFIKKIESLGLAEEFAKLPPSDSDLDAIIYGEDAA